VAGELRWPGEVRLGVERCLMQKARLSQIGDRAAEDLAKMNGLKELSFIWMRTLLHPELFDYRGINIWIR
jgi:hypothetical protein